MPKIEWDDSFSVNNIEIDDQHKKWIEIFNKMHESLMSGDTKTNNRVQEVSEISRSLKTTARELNVPIIALSQLSREVERRHPPRPILSDLRDSGSIEQDADIVIFLYRPEFYFGDSHDGKDIRGYAEAIVGKQRSGPTGMVRLKWNAPITRFEE